MTLLEAMKDLCKPNVDDLLAETLEFMEGIGHDPSEVRRVIVYPDLPEMNERGGYCYGDGVEMTWDGYADLARGLAYCNDYGFCEIRQTLIVGDGFIMCRRGYDGSEEWMSFDLDVVKGTMPLRIDPFEDSDVQGANPDSELSHQFTYGLCD